MIMISCPLPKRDHRPANFLLCLLLLGSLCTEVKIPIVNVGLQNLLIPAAAIGILWFFRDSMAEVWSSQRGLFIAVIMFSLWAFIASMLGTSPATSLYFWLKYNLLGLALPAFLLLLADQKGLARTSHQHPAVAEDAPLPAIFSQIGVLDGLSSTTALPSGRKHHWARRLPGLATKPGEKCGLASYLRPVHSFLLFLALFGIVEVIFPQSLVFTIFRSDASLSIYPRIAGLMAWPNQYGVLMAVGAVITEIFGARNLLSRRLTIAMTVLFLTQVAQSGSRNSWMVLLIGLAWIGGRRFVHPVRAVVVSGAFIFIVLLLPVSARQTGLWDFAQAPHRFTVDSETKRSPSLSSPGESLSLRSKLWREAASEIQKRPVSGLGLEIFQLEIGPRVMGRKGFNAHNLPLNITVELGFVGLTLALIVGWQLLRTRRQGNHVSEVALFMLLFAQLLDCYVHDATFMSLFYFFFAWIAGESPEP